jgi:hypothetical protein
MKNDSVQAGLFFCRYAAINYLSAVIEENRKSMDKE